MKRKIAIAVLVLIALISSHAPASAQGPITLTSDDSSLFRGQCTNLHWSVPAGWALISFSPPSTELSRKAEGRTGSAQGSPRVCPQQTTTYAITANFSNGTSQTKSLTITFVGPSQPPQYKNFPPSNPPDDPNNNPFKRYDPKDPFQKQPQDNSSDNPFRPYQPPPPFQEQGDQSEDDDSSDQSQPPVVVPYSGNLTPIYPDSNPGWSQGNYQSQSDTQGPIGFLCCSCLCVSTLLLLIFMLVVRRRKRKGQVVAKSEPQEDRAKKSEPQDQRVTKSDPQDWDIIV